PAAAVTFAHTLPKKSFTESCRLAGPRSKCAAVSASLARGPIRSALASGSLSSSRESSPVSTKSPCCTLDPSRTSCDARDPRHVPILRAATGTALRARPDAGQLLRERSLEVARGAQRSDLARRHAHGVAARHVLGPARAYFLHHLLRHLLRRLLDGLLAAG